MRVKKMALTMLLVCAVTVSAGAAATVAKPSAHQIFVDGEKVNVAGYMIDDNNYFKLRDIASILNGTSAQFEVVWDAANNAVRLQSGKAYTAVGGECAQISSGDQNAVVTSSAIYNGDDKVELTVYEIGGNNYFKLRDIGQCIDFAVDWDEDKQSIMISSDKGYTSENTDTSDTLDEPQEPPIKPTGTFGNFSDHELWQIVNMLDYGEVNPEYQRWVDAFDGDPVTVTVDIEFYDAFNNKPVAPANIDIMLENKSRTRAPEGFVSLWPKGIPIERVKTDENGKATITVDIPQETYKQIKEDHSWYLLAASDGTRWRDGHDFKYLFMYEYNTLYDGYGTINYEAIQRGTVTMNLTPVAYI